MGAAGCGGGRGVLRPGFDGSGVGRVALRRAHTAVPSRWMDPGESPRAAAAAAVAEAAAGRVAVLMKGSLHTDELMEAVVAPYVDLRTTRRMSHVWMMDVPTYSRPLFITDAALNICPSLEDKRDIV